MPNAAKGRSRPRDVEFLAARVATSFAPSKIVSRPADLPRGVTVTQPRKLSGLFLVRIRQSWTCELRFNPKWPI
ncbi:MAG: hypothetical protein DMF27_12825 [Verrucomicrobia bacterium]|nr:MAG: hypothetical protein DMF27_12825 [Verrucomicrobiota bacterium]